MSKRKFRPWELAFYFSLLVILFWLILKLVGVINTPPLIQYGVPIASALFGFFALYRDIMGQINRFGRVLVKTTTKVEYIEKKLDYISNKVNNIERDVEELKHKR